jgi:hypothetical protein
VTGQTPDISEWLDFGFYDLVWWLDRPTKPNFTDATRRLARWLGVSHRVGSDLSYWLITESGKIISKTSVEHVTRDDYLQADKKQEIENFNQTLETRSTTPILSLMVKANSTAFTYRTSRTITIPEYDTMMIPHHPKRTTGT